MTPIWQGIDQHLRRMAPTDQHRAEVRRYRQRIHDALSRDLRLMAFYQSGSFQHGTAVMPYSDVDYIARIHFEDRPSSSTTILNQMYNILRTEFSGETWDIHVDRPAVRLRFNALMTDYEVTPGYLLSGSDDDDRVIQIPAAGGGWREAAPQAHNKFVSTTDTKHAGDVREIARLLKAWKYQCDVPISSFYLEMRCAEFGKNNESIWALTALRSIVASMLNSDLAAMNDPTKLVSRISPCSGEPNRLSSMSKLRALKTNLDSAISLYFADEATRWSLNQSLQAIWGSDFPYCDPHES